MSDYQLMIKIAGQLDGSLSAACKNAQSMLDGLNKGGGALSKMAGAALSGYSMLYKGNAMLLGAMAVGAAKVAASTLKTGAQFEEAMSQVSATLQLDKTTQEFQDLQDTVMELGRSTNFTATEAAEGANILAMSGYDAYETIAALPTVLTLAGAGALSMADSSKYLTGTLASFGLDKTTDNFEHLADVMAITAASAKTDVGELGEAFTKMGANGASLQGGVNEFAALAGVLANVNITGSEAGTHIRNIVQSLQSPRNKEAAQMFEDLGISAYDAEGNLREIADIFGDLSEAMEGKTPEQIDDIMNTLFKQTDRAAAKALLTGLEDYKELMEIIEGSDGAAQEMYERQTDNLQGDIDRLSSAWEGFQLALYDAFNASDSGVRELVSSATGFVTELTDAFNAEGIMGLPEVIGNAMGNAASAIEEHGADAINAAFDFTDKLYQTIGNEENSSQIGEAAASVLTTFGERFITSTGEFTVMAGNIVSGLITGLEGENAGGRIAEALVTQLTQIGNWSAENLPDMGAAAGEVIKQFATTIAESANSGNLIGAGIRIISGLGRGLIQGAGILVGAVPGIIVDLVGGILGNIGTLFEAGKALIMALKDGAVSAAEGIGDFFHDLITQEPIEVKTGVDYDVVPEDIGAAMQVMASTGQGAFATIGDAAQNTFKQLATGETTVSELDSKIQSLNKAGESFDEMGVSVDDLQTGLETFMNAYNQFLEAGMGQNPAEGITEGMEAATEAASQFSEETQSVIDGINESLGGVDASGAFDGVTQELESAAQAAEEAGTAIQEAASETQTGTADLTINVGSVTLEGFDEAIASEFANPANVTAAVDVQVDLGEHDFSSARSQFDADAQAAFSPPAEVTSSVVVTSVAYGGASGLAEAYAAFAAEAQATFSVPVNVTASVNVSASASGGVAQSAEGRYVDHPLLTWVGEDGPEYIIPVGSDKTARGLDLWMAAGQTLGAFDNTLSAPVSSIANGAPKAEPAQPAGGGAGMNFAPVINISINGNATEDTAQGIANLTVERLRQMIKQIQFDERRAAFA